MPSAADIAKRLPLITVVPDAAFADGKTHHILSDEKAELAGRETTALKLERLCALEPSQYYFAALAEPDFGVIALVYSPDIETKKTGSANPYDTGGTLDRTCHPFDALDDDEELVERVRALQRATHADLSQLRTTLEDFLETYYESPGDYVVGKRPDSVPDTAHRDLPGGSAQNQGDRRAYTWEIRITEALRLDEELEKWATDTGTETTLQRLASKTMVPVDSATGSESLWKMLEQADRVIDELDVDAIATPARGD